jgi:hypothetical protein
MILSIDIGIKNLALCCIDTLVQQDVSQYKIKLWDVYDTLDTEDFYCESLKKDGKPCGKRCGYKYNSNGNTIYSCKTHFPKDITIKPQNNYKKRLVNDYLLQDIAKIVLTRLQLIYNDNIEIFSNIKSIVIELQPKVNQKMKFISHIIYGKLVELYYNTNTTVRFVRAAQKLKAYTGPELTCNLKGAYAKRKWLSIQYTKWFLENRFSTDQKEIWLQHFEKHKKRDDMGDTFLMSINALYGIPKKQKTDKKGKCIK